MLVVYSNAMRRYLVATLLLVATNACCCAAHGQDSSGTTAGDYMKEATETGIFRWPESRIPINVFIENGIEVNSYRPVFDDILKKAFKAWTSATNDKVRFKFASKKEDGTMIVTWTHDMNAPELKSEAGKANVTQDTDGIKAADIKLLTVDPYTGNPVALDMLNRVCLHEIGHALGVIGHSPYPDDIMYPNLDTQNGITARDVATFMAIYEAADESQAVASSDSTTNHNETEFQRLSPKNQAALLLKAGTKAVFDGKYAESMTKLNASLKLDPTNELARSNLAVAANNLAIQTQVEDERLKLLHTALYWNPNMEAARNNLNQLLDNMGIAPGDAAERIKLADRLEKSNDLMGACVELLESLRIKDDTSVGARVQSLRQKIRL